MSGQAAGNSIHMLPPLLRSLRGLQLGETCQKRAFSTSCCFSDIPPTSPRIRHRYHIPYNPSSGANLKVLVQPHVRTPYHRLLSTSTESRKSNPSRSSTTRPKAEAKRNSKITGSRKREVDKSVSDKPARAVPANERKPREQWRIQKQALKEKFKEGWNPRKKLSPDAMEGVRHLHKSDPTRFSTAVLAEYFKVSPEAIRRILKSKWRPKAEEIDSRRERWEKREARIWNQMVELGLRPPRKEFAPLSDSEKLKASSDPPKGNKR